MKLRVVKAKSRVVTEFEGGEEKLRVVIGEGKIKGGNIEIEGGEVEIEGSEAEIEGGEGI